MKVKLNLELRNSHRKTDKFEERLAVVSLMQNQLQFNCDCSRRHHSAKADPLNHKPKYKVVIRLVEL